MTKPAPRPLLVVAAVVLACTAVMVGLGAWRTGVSWDETYHVLRMRNYLGSPGWYLLDGDLSGNAPGPWEDQQFVYGPMTMILLHGWSMLWGVDESGEISTTATAYAVRHLGVGLLAVPALVAVAALARIALRSWGWGLVAAAALAAMPAWTGHSMFNVKDVPVATGYTLTTLGLVLVVTAAGRRLLVGGAATTVVGILLAVGTRPGIWPGLALATLVALVLVVRRPDRVVRWVGIAAAVAVAAVLLVVVYPAAFSTPWDALTGSVLESSRFGGISVSRWYVPTYLLAEVPTLLLLLGAGGAVLAGLRIWRGRRTDDAALVVFTLVLLQAFAIPVLGIVRGANLYNGLRQLLFAYPALAVLVTIGTAALAARRWGWVLAAVALVAPVLVQVQLFPYNYGYASLPAAVLAPAVADRWPEYEMPTDYWRTSVRELAPVIPVGGFVTCQPNSDGEGRFMRWSNDGRENCDTDVIGPLAPYDAERRGTWAAPDTEFLGVMSGLDRIGDNCTRLADVTRPMYWRTMTMSYVARCDLVAPTYPAGGMHFGSGGNAGSVQLGGWDTHPDDPGAGLRGDSAELGFVLPAWARGQDLVLAGTALGGAGMEIGANGVPLETTGSGDAFRAVLPADAAGSDPEDRLLVTVSDSDHDLRLLSLRLEEGE